MQLEEKIADDETTVAPWKLHDLRRTAATMMAKHGVSRFTLARLLNHAGTAVIGIYDPHEYLTEKRQALDLWAQHIEILAVPLSANVVPPECSTFAGRSNGSVPASSQNGMRVSTKRFRQMHSLPRL